MNQPVDSAFALERATAASSASQGPAFRHEAFLYSGDTEFVALTSRFIEDSVAAAEPILVVVSGRKIEMLKGRLGRQPEGVHFTDMEELGRNPARIIPAWFDFLAESSEGGRPVRGIGEPIWAGRTEDELVECQRHESLLNLAFAESPAWWLVCPYDVSALPSTVIEEAERNHPLIFEGGVHRPSARFRDVGDIAGPFEEPLAPPPVTPDEIALAPGHLDAVRRFVERHAAASGLGARTEDLVLAVNEIASNSLRHGGGYGTLLAWRDGDTVVCEVRDGGRIDKPLAGRERPAPSQEGGLGLWLVNQLCDLVQIRTYGSGSVVRLHMRRR